METVLVLADDDDSVNATIKDFEKGLADRGGWREEILPMPEIQASFSASFFLFLAYEKVDTILGNKFCCIWGPVSRQRSRQPLFKTSPWARREILMSRGKICETIFVSQLPCNYPQRGGYFERGIQALSCGQDTLFTREISTPNPKNLGICRNDGKTNNFSTPSLSRRFRSFLLRCFCGCAGTEKKWLPMHALTSACCTCMIAG